MRIRCECGTPVEAANVNVAAAIAKCTACGAVFSVDRTAAWSAARPPSPRTAVIPAGFVASVIEPSQVATEYRAGALQPGLAQWVCRWFRWQYVPLVAFFVFWDALCGTFVVEGLRGGGLGLFTLLLPHVWIGVGGSYYILAHLVNRSTVTLDASGLRIVSRPVPWPSRHFHRDSIAGIDAHHGWGQPSQGQWHVRIIDRDKWARALLGSLTKEEATYLAHELEAAIAKGP